MSDDLNVLDMEYDHSLVSVNINQHNFPAKLWRLTNNPQNNSVFWDPSGESLMVDQQRFEAELLSPFEPDTKLFKTSNFNSFIRQLNLYGFRKIFDGSPREKHRNLHHFRSPYFKRGQPELLVHLKRMICSERSKIQSRARQKPQHNTTDEKRGSTQLSGGVSHQQEYERSPMPGHSWIFPCTDASSFYSNIPMSLYPYATPYRVQFCPTILFPQDIPHHLSHPAAFYQPACWCCTSERRSPGQAEGYQTSLAYSHYAYYPHSSFQTTNWTAHCEPQRGDVNLDRVFQMADELQGVPNVHRVQVGSPVKTSSPSVHTSPAASTAQPASLQRIKTVAFSPHSEPDEDVLYIHLEDDHSEKGVTDQRNTPETETAV